MNFDNKIKELNMEEALILIEKRKEYDKNKKKNKKKKWKN